MSGEERRHAIISILSHSDSPISGSELARQLHVSRQVIVQDMALLRTSYENILSTHRGYLYHPPVEERYSRIFKCCHSDDQTQLELNCIVDQGGVVKNVFINHKAYGRMEATLNIRSRRDVNEFLKTITSGKSTLLKNITSDYHYHEVTAEDEATLDAIEAELRRQHLLVATHTASE